MTVVPPSLAPPSSSAPPPNPADISVEVSYAEPQRAVVKTYHLGAPSTIEDVLRMAIADPEFAGIDLVRSPVGIFGRPAPLSQTLHDGDRVEIYRPLAADPKNARRARAREGRRKR